MSKADFTGAQQSERRDRPGHRITRVTKGHPRREARRLRAAERQAAHVCGPTCKRNRAA
jgi:hypothetical protein